MNNNDTFCSVLESRRTVRSFQDKGIEQDKIERIIECGLRAPTHNHLREWHFVFLKDIELRKQILEESGAFSRTPDKKFLNEALSKIDDQYQKELYSYSVPLQERILLSAPEVLLVCFKMEKKLSECASLFDLNNFASAWLVVENILLAMTAEGLYGVTMVPFKTERLKEIVGIPGNIEVATFIPFGYPEKEPTITQIKKEPKDVIHIDKW